MTHYNYLIIGGGMTADAAVAGIREMDPKGSIGLVSNESHPPYNRPPLSKGLWKGVNLETVFRKASQTGADLHLGRQVEALDPHGKHVTDDKKEAFTYDKLLLATGGTPRRLPFGGNDILYFRTLDDYQYLRAAVDKGGSFVVIGGGFIGSEIAVILANKGQPVTMLFPEDGISARLFPADLSLYLNDYFRKKGVEILAGELITGMERRDDRFALLTKSGQQVLADHVIAGLGIIPNTELASEAGLKVDNGIIVDENLRTSQPDIYAAGDVANFYNPSLGKRMRVEHEDNSLTMGKLAGRNMAGASDRYDYLPMFYSDLFDLGYEAVGEMNSGLQTFADWQEPFREGVVFYLQENRVRGVLLWNVWGQVEAGRQLIAEPGPFGPANLKGRLPA